MSLFLLKSIIAIFFFLSALTAGLSMLTLLGKQDKKTGPETLRKIHKGAGIAFGVLLIALSAICVVYLGKAGDQISLRAVIHSYLALFLLAIFFLKFIIVRFFRQYLKIIPTLGLIVLVMAVVVFLSSAGYFFLRSSAAQSLAPVAPPVSVTVMAGNADNGFRIYQGLCAACHFPDKEDRKMGPGLRGILKKKTLPTSGRPASPDNILKQLKAPFLAMPAFPSLTEQEAADLMAYLKTL